MKIFKILILLLFASLPLSATKLVDFSVYDRDDRVDLMFSFDSSLNELPVQSKKDNFILLSFNDLNYDQNQTKKLQSKLINQVLINSSENKTSLMIETKEPVSINPSIINDKFGLRIRILSSKAQTQNTPIQSNANTLQTKNSSLEGFDLLNYTLILGALVLILILLWWLKYKLNDKTSSKGVKIVFQKQLDKHNKFVILEHKDKQYTLILGASNVLLQTSDIQSQDESLLDQEEKFSSIFEANKQKIKSLSKNKNL